MAIRLGDRVQDRVTSFTGIAVSRLEYLDGGVEIGIRALGTDKDLAMPKIEYVSESQLKRVDDGIRIKTKQRRLGFNVGGRDNG
jgi:hypothetical protein